MKNETEQMTRTALPFHSEKAERIHERLDKYFLRQRVLSPNTICIRSYLHDADGDHLHFYNFDGCGVLVEEKYASSESGSEYILYLTMIFGGTLDSIRKAKETLASIVGEEL